MFSGLYGFLGDVANWFAAFKVFLVSGAVGAVACFVASIVAWVASPFLGRAWGLATAALVGLVIVGGVAATDTYRDLQQSDAQRQIDELAAENAEKALKIDEIRRTTAALQKDLAEQRKADAANAAIITDLNRKLDASGARPECIIPEDIVDEINKIR